VLSTPLRRRGRRRGARHIAYNASNMQEPSQLPVTLADVRAAAARLEGAIQRTPAAPSDTLSELTGCRVHLKFEIFQFTGSFKERGALNKILTLADAERRRGVLTVSAGNHAQ